jgi:hypothetical protein
LKQNRLAHLPAVLRQVLKALLQQCFHGLS